MEPDTSHRLRFTIVRPDDGASVVFEVRFTTGSGPWSGSDAIPTVGNVYYEYSQGMVTTAECQAVVAAQECFDTGNPQRNVLKTSDPGDAIALLARRADGEQLPGEITPVYAVSPCTEPIYVVNWGQGGGSGCYEVGVMRPTGAVVWSEPWCEQVALGGLGSCSGRARTGTDAGLPLLVPLLLVAWRIARRRSA
jgi:hypothetical protein